MMDPAAATAAESAAAVTCWSATCDMPPLPMSSSSCLVIVFGCTPSLLIMRCSSMPLSLQHSGCASDASCLTVSHSDYSCAVISYTRRSNRWHSCVALARIHSRLLHPSYLTRYKCHPGKQSKAAFRATVERRSDSPLLCTLAGCKQGVVDMHCRLHAPAHHALPHLQRFAPVALHAAAQEEHIRPRLPL